MMKKLSELSILYLDSLGFESDASIFWINAFACGKLTRISFTGILHIRLSRDFSELDEPDLTVIDINHEIRPLTLDDLKGYNCGYTLDNLEDSSPFHIINFVGHTMIFIICRECKTVDAYD
jgi:hypothetical protein